MSKKTLALGALTLFAFLTIPLTASAWTVCAAASKPITASGSGVDCNRSAAEDEAYENACSGFHAQCHVTAAQCNSICARFGPRARWLSTASGIFGSVAGRCIDDAPAYSGGREGPRGECSWGRRRYHADVELDGPCGCVCRVP